MEDSSTRTLVIQSQAQPLPFSWLEPCLESVVDWCKCYGYEYRFYEDELFDFVDPSLIEKFSNQKVIITDLARLKALSESLHQGYDRVIWVDADFLVFSPDRFQLPKLWELSEGYMLGREVWVQSVSSKLKAHVKVHNAFLLFDRGNTFLDFYMNQAERFLYQCNGRVPPQFIGPKLLTALHNVIQCPVMEEAAMFSPEVLLDLLSSWQTHGRGGDALALMLKRSSVVPAGANLCSSLTQDEELNDAQMQTLIEQLITEGLGV